MIHPSPTDYISQYFTYGELIKSSTAARMGIHNIPNAVELANAIHFATNVLDPIREHFGSFSPQSWFRSIQLEYVLCAKSYKSWCVRHNTTETRESWINYIALKSHPKGQAADIEISGVSNDELFEWIKSNITEFDQLIREYAVPDDPMSGWVHVSLCIPVINRQQTLSIG